MDFIKKKEPKSFAEIESNLWKNNITFENRRNKDFLDVSSEDFRNNKTKASSGEDITPSCKLDSCWVVCINVYVFFV